MSFPVKRLRRLRVSNNIRRLVRETSLSPDHLIAPLFVVSGKGISNSISSLAGQFQLSPDLAAKAAADLHKLGIPAVLLFGIPDRKDSTGSSALDDDGVVQQAIRAIKDASPETTVITDLCFCEYTSHGHCGILDGEKLDNDATLEIITTQSISHAKAGADIIAPSGMIDGMVGAIRQGLDECSFKDTLILSYAAKFASSFYGPFREAVDSAPEFGDRTTYQMDPANKRQAMLEVDLDIEEGADMLMVKPALAYLDVIQSVRERCNLPLAAYNVSGEFAMVKAAAEKGWIDGDRVMKESLLAIKRAGADMIISYFAEEFARSY